MVEIVTKLFENFSLIKLIDYPIFGFKAAIRAVYPYIHPITY